MKPKTEHIKSFCVAGLCVRTKNIDEFNSQSAKNLDYGQSSIQRG